MESLPTLLGGIVLFLFGMALLGENLHKLSGGRAETMLRRMTDSRWRGMALGFLVTAVIQSSTATTVLAVSLTDTGVLSLRQAVPLIVGSNIGTTVTAWIVCLGGTSGAEQVLNAALASAGLYFYILKPRHKACGGVLLGLFLLLSGMGQMTMAAVPFTQAGWFSRLPYMTEHPVVWILAGATVTAVLQSSSASVGLLQAFSASGRVSWGMAVPLVLGENIGTCFPVLLASIGAGPNARRAALSHLGFNLIGTIILLPPWLLFGRGLHMASIDAVGIATVHTGFNLLAAILLLPFVEQFERLTAPGKIRKRSRA